MQNDSADPRMPGGNNDEMNFHQKVREKAFGQANKLRNSKYLTWNFRHNGIFPVVHFPNSAPNKGGQSNIIAMQVVAAPSGTNDYFTAKIYTFAHGATGSTMNVALPWHLRNAQNPGGTPAPEIWPPYVENDIIRAEVSPTYGTGVSSATIYLDVNWGAKAWAQRITYYNASCVAVHRFVVASGEISGT